MGWNYLSIPKLQRCNRWSLGMDKWFYPTFYWARDYLSMLLLKWIHVSKRGPRCLPKYFHVTWPYWDRHIITPVVVNNNQIRCGYFLSKVNIWNFNRARVTAFIFDSRTYVFVKVSNFFRQKMSRHEGTRTPNLPIHAECSNHLSYHGHTFAVSCFGILALVV